MGRKGFFSLLLAVALAAGLLCFAPAPAMASHKGPSEYVGALVGHLPALPLAAVVGGPFWVLADDKTVFNDVGRSVVKLVSWAVAIPEHMLLGVVGALTMVANGEGCDDCPLALDSDRAPPSL